MKVLVVMILVLLGVTSLTDACKLGLGRVEFGEQLLHTISISHEVVQTPTIMSLEYDYLVSPADIYLQITRVEILTTLVGVEKQSCQSMRPTSPTLPQGFRVTVSSTEPVTQMYGTAKIYGVRRIN